MNMKKNDIISADKLLKVCSCRRPKTPEELGYYVKSKKPVKLVR